MEYGKHRFDVRYKRCTSRYHEGDRHLLPSEFNKHPNTKDGLQASCKKCVAAAQRKYYRANGGYQGYKERRKKRLNK